MELSLALIPPVNGLHDAPPTTKGISTSWAGTVGSVLLFGVVHANVRQKLLNCYPLQAKRGFAAWAVFVGRTVFFVHGKGKGA